MAKQIYFEKQDEELQLCGQHALNNLLQGAYFTAFDLGDIGAKLDEEERNLYTPDTDDDSDSSPRQQPQSYHNVSLYGAFSVDVLTAALRTLNLDTIPLSHPNCAAAKEHPENEDAFLVNWDCHWMCYRKIHGFWYALDSIPTFFYEEARPIQLSADLLSSQIEHIQRRHQQIYVIRGALPEDGRGAPKSDELKDDHQWLDCDDIQRFGADSGAHSESTQSISNDSGSSICSDDQPDDQREKDQGSDSAPDLAPDFGQNHENVKSPKPIGFQAGFHIKWNIKPLPKQRVNTILSLQNYECASCRARLRPNFLSKSNYFLCHYTGSMHCTQCHRGQKAIIPSRLVTTLNCKPQTVCVAAKRYLDAMGNVPCIAISDFAPHRKVQKNKKMQRLKRAVLEMMAMESYLTDCESLQSLVDGQFEGVRHGLLSWKECVAVLSSDYLCKLEAFSERLKAHIIRDCDHCKYSGNHCVMQ